MALTDERALALWVGQDERFMRPVLGKNKVLSFARTIEAEVRKQDEALIRQMLEAMVGVKDLSMGGELALWTAEFDRILAAINAANTRLAQPPTS